MNLQGKKALVTGGSRGLGLAICKRFLAEGATVAITGRSMERLQEACTELNSDKVIPIEWDVSDVSRCAEGIEKAAELMGGLDILVNNAGVLTQHDLNHEFFNITEEDWDYVQGTNLKAVFFMCQAAARYMIDHKTQGHICNICSEMGHRPVRVTYGITKWGVIGLTKGLGKYLGPEGIVVNGISPGTATTSMVNWHEGDSTYRERHANHRYTKPEEIAALCAFLSSEDGDNIIGEVVLSDGGSSLR